MTTRVSIITAVYNRGATLATAIESVLKQTGVEIEYIVVDGMSNDDTVKVITNYSDQLASYIREPDEGIYDALNKGLRAATGDIIGFVHADDMLANPNVISHIVNVFESQPVDGVYGDLVYVAADTPDRLVRYWKSGSFIPGRFRWGWMPPHPTFYLKREIYEKFGGYRSDFEISADYELLVRMMVKHQIQVGYLDEVVVRMRTGGKSNSSLHNRLLANREDLRAWTVNGMRPPLGLQVTKPLRKVGQYFARPKYSSHVLG